MSSVVKQQMNVLKLFPVTAGSIHSFQIRSNESLRIMYPSIRFWIWSKESTSVVDHLDQ